jgi:hypothetical protein
MSSIRDESHVTRCLVGSVNKTALLFSAECKLSADKLSLLKKGEKHLIGNNISYFKQIGNKFIGKVRALMNKMEYSLEVIKLVHRMHNPASNLPTCS